MKLPPKKHEHDRAPAPMMTPPDPAELMRTAIAKCRLGIAEGQSPFGCAIWIDGVIVAAAHNRVVLDTDITAHAEIVAIREACRARGQILLEGAVVATTCEPCAMCMAALHWARVDTVYFGAAIQDARAAGFNELAVPAEELLRHGGSSVRLAPETLREECRQLFDTWLANANRVAY